MESSRFSFAQGLVLALITVGAAGGQACGGSGVTPSVVEGPRDRQQRSDASDNASPEAAAAERRHQKLVKRCQGVPALPTRAPLRRLSQREYRNTIRDLFPGLSLPTLDVIEDERVEGFDNGADGQQPSQLAVERYAQTAHAIAKAAVGARRFWAPCRARTLPCAKESLEALSERAYRRPLGPEDKRAIQTFMDDMRRLGANGNEALQAGVGAILQSPSFLYRPELGLQQRGQTPIGNPLPDHVRPLTGRELASRLSYFLWASLPDAQLLAAADAGALDNPSGIQREAKRLLADPRARAVVNDFFSQWLGLYRLDEVVLERTAFPEFDDLLRRDLYDSGMAYIDHAVWELDSWTALMTGDFGFVNDRLAPIFGVQAPPGDALTQVALPGDQRRGVLTQPAVLAATSHGVRHAPILRGVHVLNRIMCADLPDPPADVFNQPDLIVDESAICTTRDEVSLTHTAKPGCVSCHDAIDAAGFNFEHYDGLGRYRTQENGCTVDGSGSYPGTDVIGAMPSAVALAERLPKSRTASACLVQHLYSFALGRPATDDEQCEVLSLAEPLLAGRDSLQQLVLSLVVTPSFRTRPLRDIPRHQAERPRRDRKAEKLAEFLRARHAKPTRDHATSRKPDQPGSNAKAAPTL